MAGEHKRWIAAGADPEYAGRSWPRLRHTFSFYALIDLVAIAPFYLAQFVTVDVEMLRVLRMLRLMRMLKLTRYNDATAILFKVVVREWPVMSASAFIMMLLVVFSLAGIPPTVGFFAKLTVLQAAFDAGFAWLVVFARSARPFVRFTRPDAVAAAAAVDGQGTVVADA